MTDPIPIHIAVEDFLSEMVLRVMLKQSGRHFVVGACMGRTGFGYLKKNITGFNKAAKRSPSLNRSFQTIKIFQYVYES